jgi:hypothetical protein
MLTSEFEDQKHKTLSCLNFIIQNSMLIVSSFTLHPLPFTLFHCPLLL